MGLFDTLGTVLGGAGGFLVGGPAGAAVGAGLGGQLGGSIEQSKQRGQLEDFRRQQLRLQQEGLRQAQDLLQEREPLREAAFQRLGRSIAGPRETDIFGSFLTRRAAGLPVGFTGGSGNVPLEEALQQLGRLAPAETQQPDVSSQVLPTGAARGRGQRAGPGTPDLITRLGGLAMSGSPSRGEAQMQNMGQSGSPLALKLRGLLGPRGQLELR